MRIVLAPVGTRGDVEPLLALSDVLRERGHECVLAAPRSFAATAEREGLAFVSLGPGFEEFARGQHNEFQVLRAFQRRLRDQYDGLIAAAEGAHAIVGAMLLLAGPSVARRKRVPWIYAGFSPHYLRSELMVPGGLPVRSLPRWALRAFNRLQRHAVPLFMQPWVAEERRLGFERPIDVWEHMTNGAELLLGYDEALLPTPLDAEGRLHRVGVMRRAATGGTLDADLSAFLDAGPAPAYIGFGSMSHLDPRRLTRLVLDGVGRAGVRAVVNAGWSGLSEDRLSDRVRIVRSAPHDALFPRCMGVVHHGGAGTLHAAAIAGVPQAIVHHWADQIHHGWRVESMGLGPAPTMIGRLSATWLAAALCRFRDDAVMRVTAAELGTRMRQHVGGAERAADVVERAIHAWER